ncbi:protein draper-like [Mizuhopecten yessoensis]|uniref:protein draper-like n=1 Tax=Mizuhopecten yessoensis TaxID=6573 RepID=UPI000B459674|nr:protein draper-like [Mizuhopecten yessoensis]
MLEFVKLQMCGMLTALILLCFGHFHVYSSRCSVGRFGDDCSFTCYCAKRGCDPDTGQCDVAGCQTGWTGPNCYVAASIS